ncbi:BON domain-containing protein [Vogesella sp. LYT5W]|uniref:BON domain-containing protein n=1 Tax=Vogesella margarita TaxID=2984199 RepID=A0ABT5IP92_9NEIS|nr:BON domain-containing protein [Vogesella margarita]MDC7714384.1 BON domain-containing protein [Vogesella margarita]
MMKNRLLALLLASSAAASLSACFPLVAGGVAAGALVATDRRTSGAYVEDQAIELKSLRQTSERFAGARISITSYNRAVLISGEALNEAQRQEIEMMVRGTPNVQRVYNHLVVAPVATLAQKNNDLWITTKVRTRLLEGKGYPPQAIKVVTDRGVVYLLGLVTANEGAAAADVASRTTGVQQVVTLFETLAETPAASIQPGN